MHGCIHACPQAEERLQLLAGDSQLGRGEEEPGEEELPDYIFTWLHEASGAAGPAGLHLL